MIFKSISLIITISILCLGELSGQSASSDSTFVDRSVAEAIAMYNAAIKDQSLLFNGVEYKAFPEPYDGHPFFESEYIEEGSVSYDGELYENVPIQYDLLTDILILEHYDQRGYVGMVKPHQEKIKSFYLLDHTFIRVAGDTTGGVLRNGYYDVLYNGTITLLAKRKKTVNEDLSFSRLNVSFPQKNTYYLSRNGEYFVVRNKSSLIKVLKDRKKLLNQFAGKNQLDFVRDKEKAMVALLVYYDQIQN